MSRLINRAIVLPSGVSASFGDDQSVLISGPLGTLSVSYPSSVGVEVGGSGVFVRSLAGEGASRELKSILGTVWAGVRNAVKGVSSGYSVELNLVGIGYRAALANGVLQLSLGYSHGVEVRPLPGVEFSVEGNTKILVKGIDKESVGRAARSVEILRLPDVYKNKGVRKVGRHMIKKQGKGAKR